tara:strand:+ start:485 stop:793 length:309 start_codon:yes stop_codon:yes gene_type:complete
MVSKPILFIDIEAQKEIDEAIEYYETVREGLGFEFYNYLDGYFKTLQQNKAQFQIKRKPIFRELPLKRFPYVIIYEHNYQEIYIYSVFNTNQNPKHKKTGIN